MKSLKIKLSYDELMAWDKWFTVILLYDNWENGTNSVKCVFSILKTFHLSKLKPKTYFFTRDKISFKLDAPLAFALAFAIDEYGLDLTDYLGNSLRRIAGEIDQHFI